MDQTGTFRSYQHFVKAALILIITALNSALCGLLYRYLSIGIVLFVTLGPIVHKPSNGLLLVVIFPVLIGSLYFIALFFLVPVGVLAPLSAFLSRFGFLRSDNSISNLLALIPTANVALLLVGKIYAPSIWYPAELERVCPFWLLLLAAGAEAVLVTGAARFANRLAIKHGSSNAPGT